MAMVLGLALASAHGIPSGPTPSAPA